MLKSKNRSQLMCLDKTAFNKYYITTNNCYSICAELNICWCDLLSNFQKRNHPSNWYLYKLSKMMLLQHCKILFHQHYLAAFNNWDLFIYIYIYFLFFNFQLAQFLKPSYHILYIALLFFFKIVFTRVILSLLP